MLLIETRLAPSAIAGTGVFAVNAIAAGERVWRYDTRIDREIPAAELNGLTPTAFDDLLAHTTFSEAAGVNVWWGDNARFLNHAEAPNLSFREAAFGEARAARDIAAGEELTCDYRRVCDRFRRRGGGF